MADFEKYELHLSLVRILRPDYYISFEDWKNLVQNAEKHCLPS